MQTFDEDHDGDGETYYPPYYGLPPETVRAGYRKRPEETWTAARDAYLAGETAESVCDRFNLSLGTFRQHARDGGWRRIDQPAPAPMDDYPVDETAGYAELAEQAMARLRRAVAWGRASEAASWMRLHDRLRTLAAAEAPAPEAEAAPEPTPGPTPQPAKPSIDDIAAVAAQAGDIIRRTAAAAERNDVEALEAIEADLDALTARWPRFARATDSDDSDDSDSVFSPPEPQPGRADLLRTRERRLGLGLPVGDLDAALARLDEGG